MNNSNTLCGSIAHALGDGSQVSFTDTNFMNNTSVNGGIFMVSLKALISWTRWNITNNFAITCGVVYILEAGYFKFYDSDISNNYAVAYPISEISSSQGESEINGWTISGNSGLSPEYVRDTFIHQGISFQLIEYRFY